jgi:hypothetical protein
MFKRYKYHIGSEEFSVKQSQRIIPKTNPTLWWGFGDYCQAHGRMKRSLVPSEFGFFFRYYISI